MSFRLPIRHNGLLALSSVAVLLAVAGPATGAVPGQVDRSFGDGGRLTLDSVFGSQVSPEQVVVRPSGRVLVAVRGPSPNTTGRPPGRLFVLGRDARGRVDRGFGNDGAIASASFGGVLAQPDGKFLVPYVSLDGSDQLRILRYDADGRPDPSWRSDVRLPRAGEVNGRVGVVQPDGKVLIAGGVTESACDGPEWDITLTRLNPDGSLDGAFGAQGTVEIDRGGSNSVQAIGVRPDGRIVLAVANFSTNICVAKLPSGSSSIMRLLPDGRPDPSFDDGFGPGEVGLYTPPTALGFLVLPSGQVLASGSTDSQYDTTEREQDSVIARYNDRGQLDRTFGVKAGSTTTSLSGRAESAFEIERDSQGRIVIASIVSAGSASPAVAIARFSPSGRLDRTFGKRGRILTDLRGDYTHVPDIAVQPDGRILLLAYSRNRVALIRYHGGSDRTRPRIKIAGLPRARCLTRTKRLRVRITDTSPLAKVAASLSGRKLRVKQRSNFSVRIVPTQTRLLKIVAKDIAGNRSRRSVVIRRCG